jgi:Zn-dependent protease
MYRLRIANIAGIPIYIHATFLLLIAFVAYQQWEVKTSVMDNLHQISMALILVLSLFMCVILHELGHAFAARRFGFGTLDIVMYPIGGVARLMGIPRKPIEEMIVAVAGPMVNVLIAMAILFFYAYQGSSFKETLLYSMQNQGDFWHVLLNANIFLVLFNMIPAFPMDGGRVLRAVLATQFGRLNATFYAMWIGRIFAVLFIIYSLFSLFVFKQYFNIEVQPLPFLMLIGGFILVGASREYEMEQHSSVLRRKTVQDILRDRFCTVLYNDPIQTAINLSINGMEKDFLIGTLDGRISGLLTREAIEEALKNGHAESEVRDYALIDFEPLSPTDSLQIAMDRMHNGGYPMLPVVHENRLLGVVDLEKITWLMKID